MTAPLLTEAEVRQRLRRRIRAFSAVFVPGFLLLLGYFALAGAALPGLRSGVEDHYGPQAAQFVDLLSIAAAFPILLESVSEPS